MPVTVADTLRGLRFGPFQALLLAGVVGGSVYLLTTPHYLWALLPGPLVLALYLLGRYPQFALYFFVFLMPFSYLTRWTATPGEEITVSKFLGIWIVTVALSMLLVGRWQARHLRSRLWPFIVAFLAINLVATLRSDYFSTALVDLRQLAVAVVVFALVLLLLDRRGLQNTLPTVMIWSILANFLIFLLEFRFGLSLPGTAGAIYKRDVTLPAYALPTGYSTYLAFLLPFIVHRFFFSRSFVRRALYGVLALVPVAGIVYLGSRAAFVLLLFLTVLLCLQYLKMLRPRLIGFLIAGLCAAAVLVILFVPATYWERQKTMADVKTDASVGMRVAFLKTGWELFLRKPFLGFGPGTFLEEYATTPNAAKYSYTWGTYRMRAHNTYLEVLVGSGLPSLLCFLLMIGVALWNFRIASARARQNGDLEGKLLANAYEACFLLNLMLFFFISYLSMKHFWIFLAISQIARNSAEKSRLGGGAGEPT